MVLCLQILATYTFCEWGGVTIETGGDTFLSVWKVFATLGVLTVYNKHNNNNLKNQMPF